ncbi:Uncharacterised protein [Salmonella enterica subsp. arizonae]|nr:Uncharacterised protein [Salmonella enterica subsp. arizonae]
MDVPKRMSSNRKNSGSGPNRTVSAIPVARQIVFRTLRDGTRVTVITLQSARFQDIATDNQGRVGEERVDNRSRRIRISTISDSLMPFQPPDRGAVKHFAFFKEFGIYLMSRNRDVLFFAFGIGEAQDRQTSLRVRSASSKRVQRTYLYSPGLVMRRSSW